MKLQVDPLLFSTVIFDFHICHNISFESQISTILSNRSPACQHAQTLNLLCLDPIEARGPSTRGYYPPHAAKLNKASRKKAANTKTLIRLHLGKAIAGLQNIRHVKWRMSTEESMMEIITSLGALPHLESLALSFPTIPISLSRYPVNKIKRLRSLSISFHGCYTHAHSNKNFFMEGIGELIASNHMLSDLSMDGLGLSSGYFQFQDLFPPSSATSSLKLRTLAISGLEFDADIKIPFNLGSLVSLSISNLLTRSSDSKIWKELASTQVHLTKVVVSSLTPPLLNYLRSYSGLETLVVLKHESDLSLGPFYNEILPMHCDSLTNLSLRTARSTDLCLKPEYAEALGLCFKLTELVVTLSPENGFHLDEDGVVCKLLTTASTLKYLTNLTTVCSNCSQFDTLDHTPTFFFALSCSLLRTVISQFSVHNPEDYTFPIHIINAPVYTLQPTSKMGVYAYTAVEPLPNTLLSSQKSYFTNDDVWSIRKHSFVQRCKDFLRIR
ncbi:hypothetical protein B0H34DRAFT_714725 [Crassisporium funariophilum]|nr:hypothetical protein B0H34DRAFT_714725 [Crassisporium funariophilum]